MEKCRSSPFFDISLWWEKYLSSSFRFPWCPLSFRYLTECSMSLTKVLPAVIATWHLISGSKEWTNLSTRSDLHCYIPIVPDFECSAAQWSILAELSALSRLKNHGHCLTMTDRYQDWPIIPTGSSVSLYLWSPEGSRHGHPSWLSHRRAMLAPKAHLL